MYHWRWNIESQQKKKVFHFCWHHVASSWRSVGKLVGARPINYPSWRRMQLWKSKIHGSKRKFSSSIHTFTCSLNIHHHAINLAYKWINKNIYNFNLIISQVFPLIYLKQHNCCVCELIAMKKFMTAKNKFILLPSLWPLLISLFFICFFFCFWSLTWIVVESSWLCMNESFYDEEIFYLRSFWSHPAKIKFIALIFKLIAFKFTSCEWKMRKSIPREKLIEKNSSSANGHKTSFSSARCCFLSV